MKFFIDTADVSEIKDLSSSGFLDGVTTNPSLIKKSGRNINEVIAEICDIVPGPVSAEVAAINYDDMIAEAQVLKKIAKITPGNPPPVPKSAILLHVLGLINFTNWALSRICLSQIDFSVFFEIKLCFLLKISRFSAKSSNFFIFCLSN